MKKIKLLTIGLSIPAIGGLAAPLALLTSCGEKILDLNIVVNPDEHVQSYNFEGELKTRSPLQIHCVLDDGFEKISESDTKITVGGKELTYNTDWEIINFSTIYIHSEALANANVNVDIVTVPTVTDVSVSLKMNSSFIEYEDIYLAIPGQTMHVSDLEAYATKGDGSHIDLEYGSGNDKYVIGTGDILEFKEIEGFGTNGYTFTEEDADPSTYMNFKFKYSSLIKPTLELVGGNLMCGKKPTTDSFKIKADSEPIKIGSTRDVVVEVGTNEFAFATFERVDCSSGLVCYVDSKDGTIQPKTGPGGDMWVKVKATSVVDPNVSYTQTYTIVSA